MIAALEAQITANEDKAKLAAAGSTLGGPGAAETTG